MAATAAVPGILALLRSLGLAGAEAAPSAAGAATGLTRAQQIARAATAERQAEKMAIQQRMAGMADRGAGASAPAAASNLMSPTGATLAAGAAIPMADSPLSFLPKRAEGDPAGAMNRRNAPADYGMSDAAYRFRDLPSYEGEGSSRAMPEPASDPGRSDYDALFRSLMAAPQRQASAPAAAEAVSAPAAPESKPSMLSEQSSADLMRQYNNSMKDDGGGQASLLALAERAQREGRANGGAAGNRQPSNGGGKDAALYKALEIIHHMMVNR